MSTSTRQPAAGGGNGGQPQTAAGSRRLLRILVVDDDADTAKMSAILLKVWGYDVRTAHNGPDALLEVTTFNPDVILLDIGIPGMNGFEVAGYIRSQPHLKHIRLVAVTGYGHEADRELTVGAGFDVHLVKPADRSRLQQILSGYNAELSGTGQ